MKINYPVESNELKAERSFSLVNSFLLGQKHLQKFRKKQTELENELRKNNHIIQERDR